MEKEVYCQTELAQVKDENGVLTGEGKFWLELYLRCLNPAYGECEWQRIMRDPRRKVALEELLGKKLT